MYWIDEKSTTDETENEKKKKDLSQTVWEEGSGKGRRGFLLNVFAYNYVNHRGSNHKLLYHILKGKVMGLCGIEPCGKRTGQIPDSLYYWFESSRQNSGMLELPAKFSTTSCFMKQKR